MKQPLPLLGTLPLIGVLGSALLLGACGGSSSSPEKPLADIRLEAPADTTFSLADGPVEVQLDGSASTSPRDGTLSHQWKLLSLPPHSQATLDNTDSTSTRFRADLPGTYVASLEVADGTARSNPARITLTATSPYPTAITAPRHSVKLGADRIGLDGSASTPPTGESGQLTYRWTLLEAPQDSNSYLTAAEQAQATLHLDVEGDYHLNLIVTYNGIDSEPANVTVTVSSGNAPPVAVAKDITVKRGEEVVLDGSASYDPENAPLQYRWAWSSYNAAPKNAPVPELADRTTATARFTPEVAGEYQLEFFVFDGTWKSAMQDVTVTVENPPDAEILPPVGELVATGYFPSSSIGEQETGLRANFSFVGYDPNGLPLQVVDAVLTKKPEGSAAVLENIGSWEPLGKKIQKLDASGQYHVSMTVSNGTHEITRNATMTAKVGGINNRPSTGGVKAQRPSVIVGEPLVFDASSSDKDLDPLTFTWELIDRPDNSKAEIEPMRDEETNEFRRARVVTDVPGSYTVRMSVKDDRGLTGVSPDQESGFAKLSNAAPEIRSVVWTRNWGRLAPGENFHQILPCMSLLLRPTIVDLDGDNVDYYEELIASPEGGAYTSSTSGKSEDCPNYSGLVFTKPGDYTLRYVASDGIETSTPYDFNVTVEPLENATGVILKSVGTSSALLIPMPYENIPAFGYGDSGLRPTAEKISNWSLQAMDGDYTLEHVTVRHINGGLSSLTPRFEGLEEGTVIRQGETLLFSTVRPPVLCTRTDDETEGFHFSFRIKELPQLHFIYEAWQSTSQGLLSEWPLCKPGEVQ